VPGAYAHITLINLAREPQRLAAGPGLPDPAALALGRWLKFCELGCVSPDYPYLMVGDAHANAWADLMHYECTGEMIIAGIERVRQLTGTLQQKALAWLFGYAAHVITDATVHPIIQLKVGPYAQNKTAHRRCEMHQDAYVFQRLDLGGIGVADYLESGLDRCVTADGSLDPAVADTWQAMLARCYPAQAAANPPDIAAWQRAYTRVLGLASGSDRLIPLARHVAVGQGLTYPLVAEIDHAQYIDSLETPHGPQSYDQVFDKAMRHVIEGWHLIGEAVFNGDSAYRTAFWDWNLDTGLDLAGNLVLWQEDLA